MPGPTQLITDVAKINREYDAREKQRQETLAAYEEGALAYHAAIRYISDEPAKEAAARELFEGGNPHKMVSYADEGHKRPAWFRGLNDAMAALYGVRVINEADKPDDYASLCNGWDLGTGQRQSNYEDALRVAEHLTALTKVPHWAEDRGSNVSPRFAVIRGFQIGEPVSYGFNGDSYACGRIIAMSARPKGSTEGPRIITTQDHNGKRRQFWRRKKTGSWKYQQTWSLQHGWHSDRNPSF
ncbi:hypothetical protein BABAJAGA_00440 [Brevundimonas phage vB_BgoS-BabaJaga]|nr:hypothetical protein BABAJAGA_00440 [Brevundimonas phage vB_BgoS-BabaJaga]